jgi:hypothetical protein
MIVAWWCVYRDRLHAEVKVWGDDRVVGRSRHKSSVKLPPPGPRPLNCLVLSPDTPLLISHQALAAPNCYSAFLTAAPGLVLSSTHSTSAGVIAGTAHCCIHPRPPGPRRPQYPQRQRQHPQPQQPRRATTTTTTTLPGPPGLASAHHVVETLREAHGHHQGPPLHP